MYSMYNEDRSKNAEGFIKTLTGKSIKMRARNSHF